MFGRQPVLASLATTLAIFLAAPSMAQDTPQWDPMVERALLEKLQPKLPRMRPAYDLRASATVSTSQRQMTAMEKLATIDGKRERLRKFPGRIVWM